MAVKPIPQGYRSVTPYFVVENAQKFVDFITRAFDAKQQTRFDMPDGSIAHAEFLIGDSRIMVGQANQQWKPTTCALHLYTKDADTVYRKALDAGATSTMALEDKFYGDRSGAVRDQFGNQWTIATHKEDVSNEELKRRMKAMFKQPATT